MYGILLSLGGLTLEGWCPVLGFECASKMGLDFEDIKIHQHTNVIYEGLTGKMLVIAC
jgi:hypothetical protein